MRDNISWKAKWTINEFKDKDNEIANLLKNGLTVEQVKQVYPEAFIKEETIDFNVALNEGLQELINLLCGISGTPFNNANAYIGVGDSTTAAMQHKQVYKQLQIKNINRWIQLIHKEVTKLLFGEQLLEVQMLISLGMNLL